MPEPVLAKMPQVLRWLLLAAFTAMAAWILAMLTIPASILVGAMAAGIAVAVKGGGLSLPSPFFLLSQSVIGCLVARSISRQALVEILAGWPYFVTMVLSVSLVCAFLGWLLAKKRVLPGTTAVWGTSPGAALIMTVMSERYGADSRLVAFMQYLRVAMISVAASIAAGLWGDGIPEAVAVVSPPVSGLAGDVVLTVVLCVFCAGLGHLSRLPAGAILLPLGIGAALNLTGIMTPSLPGWLLAFSNLFVGWTIGLRFTDSTLAHVRHALPKIMASFFFLIVLCAGMAVAFGYMAGIDPLTAFLATSPGGMEAIAVITAAIGGNTSLVMAVQTTRFILVMITGPALASFVAKRVAVS